MPPLTITALTGLPEVVAGDDLATLVAGATATRELSVAEGTVFVVSSKIVSKSLGLREAGPPEAVVAGQTRRVVAERRAGDRVTRIVESRAGPVMAAAGVDASNVGGTGELLLLPHDTDRQAALLRTALLRAFGLPSAAAVGVVVSDTAGRPWRAGQTDFALGSAGVLPMVDHRGGVDADGRPLAVTVRCIVDELAAAGDLVKGKVDQVPVAIVSGCPLAWFDEAAPGAGTVVRNGAGDWFATGHVEAVRAALGVEPGSARALEVGIPSVGPLDPLAERVARVIALALDTDEVAADCALGATGATVTLTGADPRQCGRVMARLEIAARAESLVPRPHACGTVIELVPPPDA